ncbi:MAG: cache domain-containing protein, partial [Nitrospira sp.]
MREFQDTQRAAVNQIAERVRWQFQKLHDALYSLSQIPNVQFTEENEALLHLIRAYRMNEDLVDGIFRVEKTGNTLLAYPTTAAPLPAGDLQPVLREARLTGKTAHQVLTLRDGASQVLAIAKPVYTIQGEAHTYPNNKFAGLLIFTISLDRLNRNILDLPAFGPSGFFLVTTDRGIIVGAERGTLLGRSAEDLAKNYPRFAKADFLRILARMRNGETGDDTYSHPMGPGFPDLVVNQYSRYSVSPGDATDDRGMRNMESRRAAFTALMLGDDRWSVAVFSPERDVTLLIEKSIGDRWLVNAAFIATMAVMT